MTEELKQVIRDMTRIYDDPNATEDEREAALATIADAFDIKLKYTPTKQVIEMGRALEIEALKCLKRKEK